MKYKRDTPVGYNTGKVIIGRSYVPKPLPMTQDATIIQSALLKKEVDWNAWWPFTRATGAALKQLNKKPKVEGEEALI